MIASRRTKEPQVLGQQHHEQFLRMLPWIHAQARRAFRRLQREYQEELTQEVIANAFCMFARLVQRGKAGLAFASPLASFAIRQVIAGRRVGSKSSSLDVMSPCARSAHGIVIERLDTFDDERANWRAVLVEDRGATPADIAAARIDLGAWFHSLSVRDYRMAMSLALGDTAGEVAHRFGLSVARISQLRQALKASWDRFQGNDCIQRKRIAAQPFSRSCR